MLDPGAQARGVDEQQRLQQARLQAQQQRGVGGVLDGLLELDDRAGGIGVHEVIGQRGVGPRGGIAVQAFAQQAAQALRPFGALHAHLELGEIERDLEALMRGRRLLQRTREVVGGHVGRAFAGGLAGRGAQVLHRARVACRLRGTPVRRDGTGAQPALAQPDGRGTVQLGALARRAGVEHRGAHERVDEGAA